MPLGVTAVTWASVRSTSPKRIEPTAIITGSGPSVTVPLSTAAVMKGGLLSMPGGAGSDTGGAGSDAGVRSSRHQVEGRVPQQRRIGEIGIPIERHEFLREQRQRTGRSPPI